MKRKAVNAARHAAGNGSFWMLATVSCLLLLALVWQSGRYASLQARAKELEVRQQAWIDENRKLEAGVSILSSRTRTAQMAPGLGLQKADPADRLRVLVGQEGGGR